MELDFKSVKALSSPTRVRILQKLMEKESTPTDLSQDIGKSKSTVSSHLEKLQEAELIEKDEEEGRKRVTYSPTRKADAIVKGKERRVKFTLASSALSLLAGIGLVGTGAREFFQSGQDQQPRMMMEATQAAAESSAPGTPSELLFAAGGLFIALSVISALYGITLRKLNEGT